MDASADERDTRGLISMTMMSSVSGLTENWMLHPPANEPIPAMQRMARSRIFWYSVSGRVMAGATVMLSPVWTPIGSKFSMEQMMIKLPAPSRSNSNSYSFQPITLCSTSTSWVGEACSPLVRARSKSSGLSTKPPPVPPSV